MQNFVLSIITLLIFLSCNQQSDAITSEKIKDPAPVENTQQSQSPITLPDSPVQIPTMPENTVTEQSIAIEGKHALTLQWISWDRPGSVMITKGDNEWYDISGKQEEKGQYLRINGKIRVVTEKELEFNGVIETLAPGSTYCKREGLQTFLSTKNRKYWRMQNMLNCDGEITDYVDIYF